ncbi:hypothetical protein ADUPG1_000334, partial [Aduncisulcus paluster]
MAEKLSDKLQTIEELSGSLIETANFVNYALKLRDDPDRLSTTLSSEDYKLLLQNLTDIQKNISSFFFSTAKSFQTLCDHGVIPDLARIKKLIDDKKAMKNSMVKRRGSDSVETHPSSSKPLKSSATGPLIPVRSTPPSQSSSLRVIPKSIRMSGIPLSQSLQPSPRSVRSLHPSLSTPRAAFSSIPEHTIPIADTDHISELLHQSETPDSVLAQYQSDLETIFKYYSLLSNTLTGSLDVPLGLSLSSWILCMKDAKLLEQLGRPIVEGVFYKFARRDAFHSRNATLLKTARREVPISTPIKAYNTLRSSLNPSTASSASLTKTKSGKVVSKQASSEHFLSCEQFISAMVGLGIEMFGEVVEEEEKQNHKKRAHGRDVVHSIEKETLDNSGHVDEGAKDFEHGVSIGDETQDSREGWLSASKTVLGDSELKSSDLDRTKSSSPRIIAPMSAGFSRQESMKPPHNMHLPEESCTPLTPVVPYESTDKRKEILIADISKAFDNYEIIDNTPFKQAKMTILVLKYHILRFCKRSKESIDQMKKILPTEIPPGPADL